MTHRTLRALLALPVLLLARPAEAQDVEMAARIHGRALPPGYYERIREDPGFFEVRDGWTARTQALGSAAPRAHGVLPLVVIQALFADSPTPTITPAEVQRVLFDGPAEGGTLSGSYAEMSRGKLQVRGKVLPWVRTGLGMAEVVGTSHGLGKESRTGDYLVQALLAADTLVDFGAYDNDGPDGVPNSGDDDGLVDAAVFQFLEQEASCGGPAIWPHRARISGWKGAPFDTNDRRPDGTPVRVNDYIIQSAANCAGTGVQNASVIAHELGHVLGLPDLYDASAGLQPADRRWVVGCWALMAGGAWGCGDGASRTEADRPTHMGAWEKVMLGWADVVDVPAAHDQTLDLLSVRATGRVLRIPLGGGAHLLAEYRVREGFDADLPASGVLVYHVDPSKPLRVCATCPRIYKVMLLEADGNAAMLKSAGEGGNRGEAGDAFGSAGLGRLTSLTTPSTRLHSGDASAVTIYRIEAEGATARLHLSTAHLPVDRLLQPLLRSGAPPLGAENEAFLDAIGNRNGRYDVGDLRAYLREHPGAEGASR